MGLSIHVFTPLMSDLNLDKGVRCIKSAQFAAVDGMTHFVGTSKAFVGLESFQNRSNLQLLEDASISDSFGMVKHLMQSHTDSDLVHILHPSFFVMPQFYKALRTAIEFEQADYAFCHVFLVDEHENSVLVDRPHGSEVCVQLMIRRWVLDEIGLPDSAADLHKMFLEVIVSQYKGVEVPSVLACSF